MTYNYEGRRITSENLAGQVTTTAWDCCHKVSETEPDGSTTTWDYDGEGRMVATSRLIPLDMTNVTWLTTCYEYDDLGRQTATWQTNYAEQVGLPAARTRYDALGRVVARVDTLGNTTTTSYSSNGRTVSVHNPNTSTRITTRSADGELISVVGTAVTPEFHTYGILPDGSRWSRIVRGETASSPRFTKRYENLLSQTVRSEKSGFHGAVLATVHVYDALGRLVSTAADYEPVVEYTYDPLGNRVATTRTVGSIVPARPLEWRKTEATSSFALLDDAVWLAQTNIVSCSDTTIAPLVTSTSRQLTGLTTAFPACSRTTDVRGSVTTNETLFDSALVTTRQTLPYATNKPLSISRYGIAVMNVSVSAVTNTVAYDALGRQIAHTDGRGNTKHTEYNKRGQRSASIDALGNRTVYAYDQFGNLASVTNPLGHATNYEYDIRGRKTYEGGATYPVRYTYDAFGNKTTMMTYRNESLGPASGDVTTWLYDEASNCMTNKVYADGLGPKYEYNAKGILTKRTWARGVETFYAYDGWGNMTNSSYSDDTPTVSLAYDAMGRQREAHDAAGVTTFAYDNFGSLTNETVVGVAGTNILERFYDSFERSLGYSLNGERRTTLSYEPDKGRISSMLAAGSTNEFRWTYLLGSDLKESLKYPNGLIATWQYDAVGQLLQVCNATSTNIVSEYVYTYDSSGRRISCLNSSDTIPESDAISYAYSIRGELTNATATVLSLYRYDYNYDDIGNRNITSEQGSNTVYAANQLNQYSAVDTFVPGYDSDGNQTLVKTATGIWSVTFDAENRPIIWNNGTTNIVMTYDRLCRRISKNALRFVYKGFLQILDGNGSAIIWDPTESGITRPMAIVHGEHVSYYTHDGNKNVSEVMASNGRIHSHYVYSPFGAVDAIRSCDTGEILNFIRFSSEYADDELSTVYYNFRIFNPLNGRWISRDYGEELFSCNLYMYINNEPVAHTDWLGLDNCRESNSTFSLNKTFGGLGGAIGAVSISYNRSIWQRNCFTKCQDQDCSFGYTIERIVQDGAGGGLSWNLPIPGLPAGVTAPVSVSYTMSGGENYYYDSCTKREKSQKCNAFSLSGSIGASVGVGRFISYSIYGSLSYEWTDCGGESSNLRFGITVEQCYFGQCWSIDMPIIDFL